MEKCRRIQCRGVAALLSRFYDYTDVDKWECDRKLEIRLWVIFLVALRRGGCQLLPTPSVESPPREGTKNHFSASC